jgi:hypothetical protein
MPLVFPFLKLIFPLVKDHIRLVREEIMEFVGRTICCTPLIDDVIAFAIFIVVCSALQQSSPSLNG